MRINKQKGASPIVMASLVAVLGFIATEGARTFSKQSQDVSRRAVDGVQMQAANESSMELLSQLVGATVLKLDSGSSKFSLGDGLGGKFKVDRTPSVDGWSLDAQGAFVTQACLSSNLGVDSSLIFGDDKGTTWLTGHDCPKTSIVTTTIVPRSSVDADKVSGARANSYAIVDTSTVNSEGRKLNRFARLTLPEPTIQCDVVSDDNSEHCQIDHCPYMKPVLNNKTGDVLYKTDASGALVPLLQPNENFISTIRVPSKMLPTSLNGLSVKYTPGRDQKPTQLASFLNSAFKPGRINPFDGVQGVGGELQSQGAQDLKRVGSYIEIAVPNKAAAIDASKLLVFEGFLQDGSRTSYGSNARGWKTNTPFDDKRYRSNLQNACAATLYRPWGLRSPSPYPDFCARAILTYAYNTYTYSAIRKCRYYGPALRMSSDPSGMKNWYATEQRHSQTDWVASSKTEEGYTTVSSSLKPYVDSQVHHEFDNSDPQGFSLQRHDFSDVLVGELSVLEVKKFDNPDYVVDEKGKPVDNNVPQFLWKERTLNRSWDASCSQRDLKDNENPPNFKPPTNVLDKCFYIEYQNAGNRLECTRRVSAINCRNGNGCFTADTPVMMADRSMRMISDIQEGEKVFNPVTQVGVKVVSVTSGPQEREMYRITTSGEKTVTATWNHPFQTPDGFFRAYQLEEGDRVMDARGFWQDVVKIDEVAYQEGEVRQVWNLTLEGPSFGNPGFVAARQFVANGLATGDYVIQESNLREVNQQLKNGQQLLKVSGGGSMSFERPLEFEWAR